MATIVPMPPGRVGDVLHRIAQQQRTVASRHPLINGAVDSDATTELLESPMAEVLIAVCGDEVVGHLRGTTLESDVFGRSVWVSPDGVSFDDEIILEQLFTAHVDQWLDDNASRLYVWVPTSPSDVAPWLNLGFALMHQRGTKVLADTPTHALPAGYTLRRGDLDDLSLALALDQQLSDVQHAGPSYSPHVLTSPRDEWIETLEDPDVTYLVVERDGVPVAQCVTFDVPERTGSFPHSVHLSAVTVHHDHRRRGVGRAMVDEALRRAREQGMNYVETNWRVTNRLAARYWTDYGFTPTYVRMHRHVGAS